MNLWLALSLGLIVFGSACFHLSVGSNKRAVDIAQKGVEHFHRQLNSEEYQQIFAASHKEFQDAIGESKAIEYFSAARRKLGKVKSAQLKDWTANNENDQTLIALLRNAIR